MKEPDIVGRLKRLAALTPRNRSEDAMDEAMLEAAALIESQAREIEETRKSEDAQPYKDALHDLVMLDSEASAIGGGPGFKARREKAWTQARELFEP